VKVRPLAVLDAFNFPSAIVGLELGNQRVAGLQHLRDHLLHWHAKACETLPRCLDSHENRCVIAKRILHRVNEGERTFVGMAVAGIAAVEGLRRGTNRFELQHTQSGWLCRSITVALWASLNHTGATPERMTDSPVFIETQTRESHYGKRNEQSDQQREG
jgi:hypothetical protein